MTKEELIEKFIEPTQQWDEIEHIWANHIDLAEQCAGVAIEYAQQEAIGFLKWKESLCIIKEQKTGKWLINLAMSEYSLFAKNDDKLYELYLKSKQ